MYTDVQFEKLERETYDSTEETFTIFLLALGISQDNIANELYGFFRKYGKNDVVTYQDARKWVSGNDHRKRLAVLFAFIAASFDDAFARFEAQFRTHLRDIVEREIKFFGLSVSDFDIDKILSLGWGVDGLTWEARLFAYRAKWVTLICNDLKTAFLRQDTILDILVDLNKRYLSMEKILWRLYVTESTAVGSLVRREIFKHLGVEKYRFYARADERTCEHCGSLHGLIFPITAYEVGVTASPIHSHCRCWEVPILE